MQTKFITIDSEHADQRVDNFLIFYLKGVPRSRLYRALRQGEVRVNKKRVQPTYRLKIGDIVRIPPIRASETKKVITPPESLKKMLEATILLETNDYLVINKPIKLAVHGGSEISFGLIETLRESKQEFKNISLVHRLDRDTSGCLLLAKNRLTMLALQDLFRNRLIEKTYLLLVHGKWPKHIHRVTAPLGKKEISGERMVVVDCAGQPAETIFEPVQYFHDMTLMRAILITGRMHQIRVHAASIGCSVVGDRKYGDRKKDRLVLSKLTCQRLCLHAEQLSFDDLKEPNRRVIVTAPAPDFVITK